MPLKNIKKITQASYSEIARPALSYDFCNVLVYSYMNIYKTFLALSVIVLASCSNLNTFSEKQEKMIDKIQATPMPITVGHVFGSGFIVDVNKDQKKVYVLTAGHVVDSMKPEDKISVWENKYKDNVYIVSLKHDGKLIQANKTLDLALIEITLFPCEAVIIKKEPEHIGNDVYISGFPTAGACFISKGIVSKYSNEEYLIIDTTAAVDHGSSGGPIFNNKGEVIGLVVSFYVDNHNISRGVSSKEIYNWLKTIKEIHLNY